MLGSQFLLYPWSPASIAVENLHAEAPGPPRYLGPDSAHTYDPDGRVMDILSEQDHRTPGLPTTLPRVLISFDDASGRRQQKGKGEIGARFCKDSGCDADKYSVPGTCRDVYVVVSHRHVAHYFEVRRLRNNPFVYSVSKQGEQSV